MNIPEGHIEFFRKLSLVVINSVPDLLRELLNADPTFDVKFLVNLLDNDFFADITNLFLMLYSLLLLFELGLVVLEE